MNTKVITNETPFGIPADMQDFKNQPSTKGAPEMSNTVNASRAASPSVLNPSFRDAPEPSKNFIGYEYKSLRAPQDLATLYADCYPNFGWELESSSYSQQFSSTNLTFKRDRKMKNKNEINKLQRQFETGIDSIIGLEKSKTSRAAIFAFSIGIIGTAFLAGATFAYLAGLIVFCIILAIPGFTGWVLPYFIYNSTVKKRSTDILPEIDRQFDAIYATCEKANSLLA